MSDDLFALDGDFDAAAFEVAQQQHAEQKRAAVAFRTRSRLHARRVASEAALAEILPADIADGDAWHVLSQGDVDALSFLAHLLRQTPMDYVAFSTWCMAMPDVEQLRDWLQSGHIGRIDAYVGEIFPGSYSAEHEALCKAVRPGGGARRRIQEPRQTFSGPRWRARVGRRIVQQRQHQPTRRKYLHHSQPRPVRSSQGMPRRHPQFRPQLRRMESRPLNTPTTPSPCAEPVPTLFCHPDNVAEFNAALRQFPDLHEFVRALHKLGLIDGLRGARLHPADAPRADEQCYARPVLSAAAETRIADLDWRRKQERQP